jgi:hypothetical protein
MPITVTTRRWSLVMGGPDEPPELYDLERDPAESVNVWAENAAEGSQLFQQAIEFLEECGTSERFLAPRRESLRTFAAHIAADRATDH